MSYDRSIVNKEGIKVGAVLKSRKWGDFEILDYPDYFNVKIRFLNTGNVYVRQEGSILRGSVSDRDVIDRKVNKEAKIKQLKETAHEKFMKTWNPDTHVSTTKKLPYFKRVNCFWTYAGFSYVDEYTYERLKGCTIVKSVYLQFSLSKYNSKALGIKKPAKKVSYPLHCWVKAMPTGFYNLVTDHKNGCKLDNRMTNLRTATYKENAANSKATSKSGYRGVKFRNDKPRTKPWYACQCTIEDGKQIEHSLGYYENKEDAAKAVDIFNIKRFGEFVRLNLKRSIYEEMGLLPKIEKSRKLP